MICQSTEAKEVTNWKYRRREVKLLEYVCDRKSGTIMGEGEILITVNKNYLLLLNVKCLKKELEMTESIKTLKLNL